MLKLPHDSPGKKLKELIQKDTVLLPGIFNTISALSAQKAGAQALYLSGAGVTNSLLGVPDIGLITLNEMSQQANFAVQATELPIIADADTGYGESFNIVRTVIEMERAGVAGIHIEDQINPKRCGHLDGKQIIEPKNMAEKIRIAADSRKDPDFLIIGRTDARTVEGIDCAIERAKLYLDQGADIIFPEGLESLEEFQKFRQHIRAPLLANITEFGKTPLISVEQLHNEGYNLVIFPMTAFRVMLKAIDEAYKTLIQEGTQKNLLSKMKTRSELYELIQYNTYDELDKKWTRETT